MHSQTSRDSKQKHPPYLFLASDVQTDDKISTGYKIFFYNVQYLTHTRTLTQFLFWSYFLIHVAKKENYWDNVSRFFTSAKEVMFLPLFVCLLATLCKNFWTDLHEIFRECWQWARKQIIRIQWRSRTDSPDGGTDIATLVRRALAEVCTVPVGF